MPRFREPGKFPEEPSTPFQVRKYVKPPAPTVSHGNPKPLTIASAHKAIGAFIAAAETQPHLHPDAQLTSHGFAAPKAGIDSPTMHQLKRLHAGLEGKNLVGKIPDGDMLEEMRRKDREIGEKSI
ncbi:MAG: hypothetical protein M1834_006427 [Cirrosporium novae-zelandiae]|nr:MAG: hypothetical protein M1834_006427 [Cirrosporium novae-zelandiae]